MAVPAADWRSKNERQAKASDPTHEFFAWTPRLFHNLLVEADFVPVTIELHSHAWHPGLSPKLTRLPRRLYNLHARAIATARRRREIHAIAVRPSSENAATI